MGEVHGTPKVEPLKAWYSRDDKSSAEIPRLTGQSSQKIPTAVDDRDNTDALSAESIHDAIIPYDQLSYGFVLIFWNNATQLGMASKPFSSRDNTSSYLHCIRC
jgi:hypothetical protein